MIELVSQYGMKSWSFIAKQLQGRLGKQCRERCATYPTLPYRTSIDRTQIALISMHAFIPSCVYPVSGGTTI